MGFARELKSYSRSCWRGEKMISANWFSWKRRLLDMELKVGRPTPFLYFSTSMLREGRCSPLDTLLASPRELLSFWCLSHFATRVASFWCLSHFTTRVALVLMPVSLSHERYVVLIPCLLSLEQCPPAGAVLAASTLCRAILTGSAWSKAPLN
jgi:hypothetical protein